jgi:hypothetical protein
MALSLIACLALLGLILLMAVIGSTLIYAASQVLSLVIDQVFALSLHTPVPVRIPVDHRSARRA